jgi:hypothetical protein
MKNKKYHTVWPIWKTKNTTLPEQNEKQKILHRRNKMKNKKYYTVGTKWKKNTTLSGQSEKHHFVPSV